jgi:hypothetical protein
MRVEDHIDAMLDYALEMTFPASDPFAVYCPEAAIDEPAAEPQCELPDAA